MKSPSYNLKGSPSRYCKKHAVEYNKLFNVNMVNTKHKDRCEEDDCDKHPAYGVKGGKRLFCFEHSIEGIVFPTGKVSPQYKQ